MRQTIIHTEMEQASQQLKRELNYHADRYLSWGYTDPLDDWRYFGSHVGNKGSGMNVRYASDPFWGEKIAGWYYRFDSTNGLKDYNYYTIGIKQSNVILDVKSAAKWKHQKRCIKRKIRNQI